MEKGTIQRSRFPLDPTEQKYGWMHGLARASCVRRALLSQGIFPFLRMMHCTACFAIPDAAWQPPCSDLMLSFYTVWPPETISLAEASQPLLLDCCPFPISHLDRLESPDRTTLLAHALFTSPDFDGS